MQIKSVQEQRSERRRRLLATTCLVETTVTVRSSIVSVVRSRATVENLNAALAGSLNAAVVSADVVDEPSAGATPVYIYVAGGVGGAFILVGVGVMIVLWKKRNSTVPQTVTLARVVAEPLNVSAGIGTSQASHDGTSRASCSCSRTQEWVLRIRHGRHTTLHLKLHQARLPRCF